MSDWSDSYVNRERMQDAIKVVQRENAELRSQLASFGEEQAEYERLTADRVRLLAMVEEKEDE